MEQERRTEEYGKLNEWKKEEKCLSWDILDYYRSSHK